MMDHVELQRWEVAVGDARLAVETGHPSRPASVCSDTVLAADGELQELRADLESRGVLVLVGMVAVFAAGMLLGWFFAPMVG